LPDLQRILKRTPEADEAEFERVRLRALARLAAMNPSNPPSRSPLGLDAHSGPEADDPPASEAEPPVVSPVDDDARAGAPVRPVVRVVIQAQSPWLLIAPLEDAVGQPEESIEPPAPSSAGPTAIETAGAIEARRLASPPAMAPRARQPAPLAAAELPVIEGWPPAQPGFFALDEDPSLEARVAAEPAVIAAKPPAEVVHAAELEAVEPEGEVVTAAEFPVIEAWRPAQPGFFALDEDPSLEAPAPEAPVAGEPLVTEADAPAEVVDAVEPEAVEPEGEVARQPRRAPQPARTVTATRRPTDDLEDATQISSTRPVPVEATAYCPYCASLLQPPPDATRRCPRCRQRIVVRHIGTRAVYLAEAVLPFFEAERQRWARERDRWLDLARASGAAADPVQHLATEPLSEAGVAAARALYMSTVDRSFRIAKSDRRWEEAARIRYDQALALFRIAGSTAPPPEEVVKLHREGVVADLQGIGEVSKDAELRGASCCETCQVDEGRVVRIAEELRSPRLPHRGCPKGLCRCRWFLSARDQEFLSEFLRRQARANRRLTAPPAEPARDEAVSTTA